MYVVFTLTHEEFYFLFFNSVIFFFFRFPAFPTETVFGMQCTNAKYTQEAILTLALKVIKGDRDCVCILIVCAS